MEHNNPILDSRTAYEDLGPTRRSTSSEAPRPNLRPSAETKRLIGELGLRFPPAAQADLAAHAALLALMTNDLAHVPTRLLERAILDWARKSRFMPKAAELIELASSYLAKPKAEEDLHKAAAILNAQKDARPDGRRDIHWIVENGEMRLDFAHAPIPRFFRPITASDAEIVAYAKAQQASKRSAA